MTDASALSTPPTIGRRAPVDVVMTMGARISAAGVSPGSSGNVSIVHEDLIYATGTGTDLGRLTRDDVAVLDRSGRHLDGPRASKETSLHLAFYAKNPEHTAVVHVHSPNAVALSCLEPWSDNSAVPPLTPYFVMRVGQAPLIPFRVPGSPELGELVLERDLPFHAAVLANHGQIVSALDPDRAVEAAIELEEACRIALLTDGRARRLLPEADIAALSRKWGTPWTAAAVRSTP
ncbi:class II aldolase/adducin family protein [Herbiconiux flava]|uniref:L-fuculose-phosphate aldolase n=1 Tax=Herbiconiux flava TaxID=881268 RepID=A0A852SQB6_9MICO|nr:class II aldolase/adducin family protein [Herbiconiux flava]NYD71037.1 L-fuculose-phosphate aldolase [Herbiconiux flava]GLK18999.1 putative aldolase class 2 protein [Herbiconiux flava]